MGDIKVYMWVVKTSIWAVTASMWAVAASTWAATASMWAVAAPMWAVQRRKKINSEKNCKSADFATVKPKKRTKTKNGGIGRY